MSSGIPVTEVGTRPVSHSSAVPIVATMNPLRGAWLHWKRLAHAVGVVQTRFLMVGFYFLVVLPLGLVMRLADDKLRLQRPQGSCWVPHAHEDQSIDTARRQF